MQYDHISSRIVVLKTIACVTWKLFTQKYQIIVLEKKPEDANPSEGLFLGAQYHGEGLGTGSVAAMVAYALDPQSNLSFRASSIEKQTREPHGNFVSMFQNNIPQHNTKKYGLCYQDPGYSFVAFELYTYFRKISKAVLAR